MFTPEFTPGFVGTPPPLRVARFDRLAVIYNPANQEASAFAEGVPTRLELPANTTLTTHTSEPDVDGNLELLQEQAPVHERNLWVVAGGDGTVSNFLGAAYLHRLKDPVLVVPTGYANDIAHMLHRRKAFKDPLARLATGQVAPLRPLSITSEEKSGRKRQELAFGYFGIGLSGTKARDFNDQPARDKRIGHGLIRRRLDDSLSVLKTLRRSHGFDIYDSQSPETTDHMIELLFVNGNRMANTISFRTELFGDEAGRIELHRRGPVELALGLGKAALGLYAKVRPEQAEHTFTIKTDERFIISQRDGETSRHATDTTFSVGLADETLPVITTRHIHGR